MRQTYTSKDDELLDEAFELLSSCASAFAHFAERAGNLATKIARKNDANLHKMADPDVLPPSGVVGASHL